jgi:putative transposase
MKEKLWLTLLTYLSHCINKELYHAIDYLREQVRVLVEQQERQNPRILLTKNQRIRLAAKAKKLSKKMLNDCTVLFTPETILGWYRKLIAEKYDGSKNRTKVGRPGITEDIINLVIKFKEENPRWGYQKIRDQIVYLGFKISKSSVKNILIKNGLNPEPDLIVKSTWHEFLSSHWDVLAACDFFTVELFIGHKLVRCMVFFVMELSTRKVHIASITPQFYGDQVEQIARNLTDDTDGFLKGKRYLIHDRDPLYTKKFQTILESSGVKSVKLPPKSPDLNSQCERFVLSIKSECLNYLILSSVKQLEYTVHSYVAYYHHERIHQSLNRIIEPIHATDDDAEIVCIERLGGLLKSYHRLVA